MPPAFLQDLLRFGPNTTVPADLAWARRYCGNLTRHHYENFTVASLLLPRRLLRHFHAVYAYCRWADDLGDETGNRALDLLGWWRRELLQCYDGKPRHPVMLALAPTIREFQIPATPFLDLLEAFEQDQRIKRYDTYDLVLQYCSKSANPVGHLVLYLCRAFTPDNAVLADRICTALQLANFWQDVDRDYDIGRVYLPRHDMESFGYAQADLEARRFTPAFAELLKFQVDRTRRLFNDGLPLVERMPVEVRTDIDLFARGGLAILRKIEQAGYNVWKQRPVLGRWEKAWLVGGSLLRRLQLISSLS
jgi:squalene synthase HpnC